MLGETERGSIMKRRILALLLTLAMLLPCLLGEASAATSKLGSPQNLKWNEMTPGTIDFTVSTSVEDYFEYLFVLYRNGEAIDSQIFVLSEDSAGESYSVNFSERCNLESGTYYCTGQAVSYLDESHNSDIAESDTWIYTKPDNRYNKPDNLKWDWPIMSWESPYENVLYEVACYFHQSPVSEEYLIPTWTHQYSIKTTSVLDYSEFEWHTDMYGTGYWYFKVRIVSDNIEETYHSDWSELSAPYHCKDEKYVQTPIVAISANTSTGKPEITWDPIPCAEKYRIYRATSKAGTYSYLGTSTSTSYIDSSAVAGTNYYYKVKALDTDTNTYSDYSNIVNRVCDLAKPTVSLTVNTTTGKPVVKWETVEGAAKYYVYRSTKKSSGYEKVYTGVKARSYEDADAVAGTNYYYKVMAIHEKSSANSAYSTVVNRVCDLAKPVVTLTRTASGNPWVKWKAIEDADGYEVWRATSKSGTYKKVKTTVSGTSFADRNVKTGTKYYYKVRAIHDTASANSAYSSIKYITAK